MAGKKVAIVGLNVGTTAHIPGFRVEGWDVVALGAEHGEKVEATAKEHGVTGAYSDFGALLNHPGVDAIAIASPPSTHKAFVDQALAAGKHILIEKPFAQNAAEAKEMAAKAAASGKTVMIAEAYRYSPSRAYTKSLIDKGFIGKPHTLALSVLLGPRERRDPAQPRLHWRSNVATGGGFSAGPASTFWDSIIDWFGDVSALSGKTYSQFPDGTKQSNGEPHDNDESMAVTFDMANGAWGTFIATTAAPFGPGVRFELIGSEGALTVTQQGLLPTGTDAVSGGRFDEGPETKAMPIPAEFQLHADDNGPKPEVYWSYRPMIRAFTEGIDKGTSPGSNFDVAYQLQRITDAVKESSASGRRVTI